MVGYKNTPSPLRGFMDRFSFFTKFFMIWSLILLNVLVLLHFMGTSLNKQRDCY